MAELDADDTNCDDGLWRSLLVKVDFQQPTDASFSLFHSEPDQNFAVEYAAYGASGDMICAIDADMGAGVVRVAKQ